MKTTIKSGQTICATARAFGYSKAIGIYASAGASNELAAEGAKEYQAKFSIMIPVDSGRSRVNAVKKNIKNMCREQGIALAGIEQEESPAVTMPLVSVCMTGTVTKSRQEEKAIKPHPGQDIVLTKWIGMEGMLRIEQERAEHLKEVFSAGFMREIREFERYLFDTKEVDIAYSMGAGYIYAVADGGIFAALWDLAQDVKLGLELDMKALSIRQETIEVCELFRINPYQLASSGCFLILTDDGQGLAEKLAGEGVQVSVIGKLTDNNDKVIRNGDEVRYIDRPAPDELRRIFYG